MKILVTGGAGFIGSHLCEVLVENGHDVTCFDNFSNSSVENLNKIKDRIRIIKGDCNKKDNFNKLDKYETIFHYAAIVGVEKTQENALEVFEDIEGVKNILEFAKKSGTKKIIYSSSSEIYGNPYEHPQKEDGIIDPVQPYSAVKLAGELLMETYYKKFGLPTCSLRFFNVYGPRQAADSYGFVIGKFIRQVLNNESPTVYGDGHQTRTFTYVKDNVSLAIAAMEKKETVGKVINIGTDKEISILGLAHKIIDICGSTVKPTFIERKEYDIVDKRCPDTNRMISVLGHKPKISLDEGLIKTINWYKNY